MSFLFIAGLALLLLLLLIVPRVAMAKHLVRRHGQPGYPFDHVFETHRRAHLSGSLAGHGDDEEGRIADQIMRDGTSVLRKMLGDGEVDRLLGTGSPDAIKDELRRSLRRGELRPLDDKEPDT